MESYCEGFSSLCLVPAKEQLEWRISLLAGTFHTVSRIRDNAVIMQGMLSDSVTALSDLRQIVKLFSI